MRQSKEAQRRVLTSPTGQAVTLPTLGRALNARAHHPRSRLLLGNLAEHIESEESGYARIVGRLQLPKPEEGGFGHA